MTKLAAWSGLVVLAAFLLAGCYDAPPVDERVTTRIVTGDPTNGRSLIIAYGCGVCHTIAGIRSAKGRVGPPLEAFSRRVYLAGAYANRPDNLVEWLLDPPGKAPETAMPDMGLSQSEARDIASYLYSAD